MIVETGHFALVLALLVAALQGIVPLWGAARSNAGMMALARPASLALFGLISISMGALTYAYVASDFSVMNVYENSHSLKPLMYKIAGVWGNHEGSMLLWVYTLAVFGALVTVFSRNLPLGLLSRTLAVQGLIAFAFLLFILLTSNPFARVDPAPLDGLGLNPLLQDPGLAAHPPMLYMGYVGFSIVFSFAAAALIEGRVDPGWARWVRPWTLLAWVCLTAGIALGSSWAYYELGWGGFWFWDPVENASLMPWLAGTALLHSAIVVERRDTLKAWTILLAILTFSLSLMGTFLVRSGVLTSVHAFATDPTRGIFILALMGLATGAALLLFALRAPQLKAGGVFAPVSREGLLLINNLLLATACATVLIGTLYPVLMNALNAGAVTVGPPYYAATFIPLMIPLVLVMGVGPLLAWKRADLKGALQRLTIAGLLSIAVVLAALSAHSDGPVMALAGIGMAAWLIVASLTDLAGRVKFLRVPVGQSLARALNMPLSQWGTILAHGGLGIAIAGMTGASAWTGEKILVMAPGDSTEIAGYTVEYEGSREDIGPNYNTELATLRIWRGNTEIGVLEPEKRWYPVARKATTEAAIHTTLWDDIYIAIGDRDATNKQARVVRLYHHPLVAWIWLGSAVMFFGGAISLADRRMRIGAPAKKRSHRTKRIQKEATA